METTDCCSTFNQVPLNLIYSAKQQNNGKKYLKIKLIESEVTSVNFV